MEIFKQISQKLSLAKSIAILTHINEDPDTLGSCFAMAAALRSMGKDAVIYVSGKIEKRLEFMGHDYVIYTPGDTPEHDLCLCIDCGDIGRIGERKAIFDSVGTTINIDHHYSNTRFADVNYIDGDASSAGELVYRFLKSEGICITEYIANQLYTAICSDTGSFKYSNTSPQTMLAAGELLGFGIDNAEISRLLFDCESESDALLKAEVTQNMESFCGGKIRLVTMPKKLYEKYGMSAEDAPNLVDIPRRIENTEIAVCLKEQEDGIRVNLRSNGSCDVSAVAAALGGGGHKKAAGCRMEMTSMEKVKERIVKECAYLI